MTSICLACTRPMHAKGYCKSHYSQFLRYGPALRSPRGAHAGNRSHGGSFVNGRPERLYSVWAHMKERCLSPTSDSYHLYGGRGIRICDAWMADYAAFRIWAVANGYAEHLQIDRIDTDGNYEPDNCRWVTVKKNANNRRRCRFIEFDGRRMSLSEASELYGIPPWTVKKRLDCGWSVEKALTHPVRSGVLKQKALAGASQHDEGFLG